MDTAAKRHTANGVNKNEIFETCIGSIKINTITDGQIRMNLHIFAVIEKRLEFRTSLKGAFRMITVMRIPKAALLYKSAGKRHIGFHQGNA